MPGQQCPQCSAQRIGAFRFCLRCGFDYDAAPIAAGPPAVAAVGEAATAEASLPGPTVEPGLSTAPEPAAPSIDWPVPPMSPESAVAPIAEPALMVVSERPRPEAVPAVPPRAAERNDKFVAAGVAVILGLAAIVGLLRGPMPQLDASKGLIASDAVALASPIAPDASTTASASAPGSAPAIAQSSGGPTLPPTGSGAANAPSPGAGPSGPSERGVVVRIIDGDTVEVMIDRKVAVVRYLSIQVPGSEPNTLTAIALDANRALVDRQMVILERDVSDTDDEGRLLRHVWRQDPGGRYTLISAELVREGLALDVTSLPDVKYADEMKAAQDAAKADRIGLWAP